MNKKLEEQILPRKID